MRRRYRIVLGVLVIVIGLYGVANFVLYGQISSIPRVCDRYRENTPRSFTAENVDTTPYTMATYETVQFPSREATPLELSGWYVPGEKDTAVIVVHGLGACKYAQDVMLAAGILNRAGHHVLLVDLREHGDSPREDNRQAGGLEEYLDVLGAWDWLRTEQGFPAENIGLYGISFGAATALIAYGEEPSIRSIWVDSAYGSFAQVVRDELQRNGYPTFLAFSGRFIGNLLVNENLLRPGPIGTLSGKITNRPIFITHGTDDRRVDIKHAFDLATIAAQQDADFELWILQDTGHARAILDDTAAHAARLTAFFAQTLNMDSTPADNPDTDN